MNIIINKKEYEIPNNVIIGALMCVPFIILVSIIAISLGIFWEVLISILFLISVVVAAFGVYLALHL